MNSESKMTVMVVGLIAWALAAIAITGFITEAYKAKHREAKPCICGQVN